MESYKEYPIRCKTCGEPIAAFASQYEALLQNLLEEDRIAEVEAVGEQPIRQASRTRPLNEVNITERALNRLGITMECSRIAMMTPTIVTFNMENRAVIEGLEDVDATEEVEVPTDTKTVSFALCREPQVSMSVTPSTPITNLQKVVLSSLPPPKPSATSSLGSTLPISITGVPPPVSASPSFNPLAGIGLPSMYLGAASSSMAGTGLPPVSSTPPTSFGLPTTTPATSFGLPTTTPATSFGLPTTTPATSFGLPTTPATSFGLPTTTTTPATSFGLPTTTPATSFGLPTTPATSFGLPTTTPATSFGLPTTTPATTTFGLPSTFAGLPGTESSGRVPPNAPGGLGILGPSLSMPASAPLALGGIEPITEVNLPLGQPALITAELKTPPGQGAEALISPLLEGVELAPIAPGAPAAVAPTGFQTPIVVGVPTINASETPISTIQVGAGQVFILTGRTYLAH